MSVIQKQEHVIRERGYVRETWDVYLGADGRSVLAHSPSGLIYNLTGLLSLKGDDGFGHFFKNEEDIAEAEQVALPLAEKVYRLYKKHNSLSFGANTL